jgi:hypothetical protein
MMSTPIKTLLGAALAMAFSAAHALTPVSYDMPNGNGQASGGSFNYWDLKYNGAGATNVDGAPLSGGVGDLTDGIIATDTWFNVENGAGTGPYVGWLNVDPTITFHFGSTVSFNSFVIHADDSNGAGGVSSPAGVTLNSVAGTPTIGFLDPVGSAPTAFNVSGFNFTGSDFSITLHRSNAWVFVSEVEFSAAAVPEPSTYGLMLAGLGLMGVIAKRRRG